MTIQDKNIRLIEPLEDTSGMFIRHNNPEHDLFRWTFKQYLDDIHAQGKTLMDIAREAGEAQPSKDRS